MGKVVPLRAYQTPETLLEAAKDWGLDEVLIIGYDSEGQLVCGATMERAGDAFLLVEQFKQFILET